MFNDLFGMAVNIIMKGTLILMGVSLTLIFLCWLVDDTLDFIDSLKQPTE